MTWRSTTSPGASFAARRRGIAAPCTSGPRRPRIATTSPRSSLMTNTVLVAPRWLYRRADPSSARRSGAPTPRRWAGCPCGGRKPPRSISRRRRSRRRARAFHRAELGARRGGGGTRRARASGGGARHPRSRRRRCAAKGGALRGEGLGRAAGGARARAWRKRSSRRGGELAREVLRAVACDARLIRSQWLVPLFSHTWKLSSTAVGRRAVHETMSPTCRPAPVATLDGGRARARGRDGHRPSRVSRVAANGRGASSRGDGVHRRGRLGPRDALSAGLRHLRAGDGEGGRGTRPSDRTSATDSTRCSLSSTW